MNPFFLCYIIESEKVKHKCAEVSIADRASDNAVEYKVEDLRENEFETIFFKDILDGIVDVVDKKVGVVRFGSARGRVVATRLVNMMDLDEMLEASKVVEMGIKGEKIPAEKF